jgi:subtilase family serine protease
LATVSEPEKKYTAVEYEIVVIAIIIIVIGAVLAILVTRKHP